MLKKTTLILMCLALATAGLFASDRITSYVMLRIESDKTDFDINIDTAKRSPDNNISITGSVLMSLLGKGSGGHALHESYIVDTSSDIESLSLEQLRKAGTDNTVITQLVGTVSKNGEKTLDEVYSYEDGPAIVVVNGKSFTVRGEDGAMILEDGNSGMLRIDRDEDGTIIATDMNGDWCNASELDIRDEDGHPVTFLEAGKFISICNPDGIQLAVIEDMKKVESQNRTPYTGYIWLTEEKGCGSISVDGVPYLIRQKGASYIFENADGESIIVSPLAEGKGVRAVDSDGDEIDASSVILRDSDGTLLNYNSENGLIKLESIRTDEMPIIVENQFMTARVEGSRIIAEDRNGNVYTISTEDGVTTVTDQSGEKYPSEISLRSVEGEDLVIKTYNDSQSAISGKDGSLKVLTENILNGEGGEYILSVINGAPVLENINGEKVESVSGLVDEYGRSVGISTDGNALTLSKSPAMIVFNGTQFSLDQKEGQGILSNGENPDIYIDMDENGTVYFTQNGVFIREALADIRDADGNKVKFIPEGDDLIVKANGGETVLRIENVKVLSMDDRIPERRVKFTVFETVTTAENGVLFKDDASEYGYFKATAIPSGECIVVSYKGGTESVRFTADEGVSVAVRNDGAVLDIENTVVLDMDQTPLHFEILSQDRIALAREDGSIFASSGIPLTLNGNDAFIYVIDDDYSVQIGGEERARIIMDNGTVRVFENGIEKDISDYDLRTMSGDFIVVSPSEDNLPSVSVRAKKADIHAVFRGNSYTLIDERDGILVLGENGESVLITPDEDGSIKALLPDGSEADISGIEAFDEYGNRFELSLTDGIVNISRENEIEAVMDGKTYSIYKAGEEMILDDGYGTVKSLSLDKKGNVVIENDVDFLPFNGSLTDMDGNEIIITEKKGRLTVSGGENEIKSEESTSFEAPEEIQGENGSYKVIPAGKAVLIEAENGNLWRAVPSGNDIYIENVKGNGQFKRENLSDENGNPVEIVNTDGAVSISSSEGVIAASAADEPYIYDMAGNAVTFSENADGSVTMRTSQGQYYVLSAAEDGGITVMDENGSAMPLPSGLFYDRSGSPVSIVSENGNIRATGEDGEDFTLNTPLKENLQIFDNRGRAMTIAEDENTAYVINKWAEVEEITPEYLEKETLYDNSGKPLEISFDENGKALFSQPSPVRYTAFRDDNGDVILLDKVEKEPEYIYPDGSRYDGDTVYDASGSKVTAVRNGDGIVFMNAEGELFDVSASINKDNIPSAYESDEGWVFTVLSGRNLAVWEKNWDWNLF